MKLKNLSAEQVPCIVALCACLICFRVSSIYGEPVESNAPAANAVTNNDMDSGRVLYDQRQTGKYNIHVSIKDVALIEMDQNDIEDTNYSYDDYYYDEEHLTVKPIILNPANRPNKTTTTSSTASTTTLITPDNHPGTSTHPTTLGVLNNQTYSPNLLADLAATHAESNNNYNVTSSYENNNISSLSGLTTLSPTMKRAQNVVILDTQTIKHNSPSSTHKPSSIPETDVYARSKNVPIQTIVEPLLHPRLHSPVPKLPLRSYFRAANEKSNEEHNAHENDSKIFKFKARRANKGSHGGALAYPSSISTRRCRANQFRDISGNCRIKRSSSILRKLFSMLFTLPFDSQRALATQDDRDDE